MTEDGSRQLPVTGTRIGRAAARRARAQQRWRRWLLGGGAAIGVAALVASVVLALLGTNAGRGARAAAQTTAVGPATDRLGAAFAQPEVAAAAMVAARGAVQAIDSYDYRTLASALDAGTQVTTGDFRGTYRAAMVGDIAARAKQFHTVQTCAVQKVGLLSLSQDGLRAEVLVLALLSTTDTTSPAPRVSPVTLDVTMLDSTGTWLVAGMADVTGSPLPEEAPAGTTDLQAAVAAGRRAVAALLSYRRSHFAADFRRALDVLDENGRQQQEPQRAAIKAQLDRDHIDLGGDIDALAVEDAGFASVTLLAAVDHYETDAAGNRSSLGELRVEVGMLNVGGAWLVDSFVTLPSS